jgi:PAS domain S-box-containing protein
VAGDAREGLLSADLAIGIVEVAPIVVLVIDREGSIEYVNPFFERLTGYALAEIRGKDWFGAFLPARDRERIRDLFHRSLAELPLAGNVNPIVTRTGEEREVEWHARVLRAGESAVTGLVAIGKDVTEERAAHGALRASEAGLRQAQALAKLGSWELDLVTGALEWSDEVYRIFEIDRTRFGASYEAFLDAIHPEDRTHVDQTYRRSVETGEAYGITHRIRTSDGRVKHVREKGQSFYDLDGEPIRSVGTVQDVTAEVAAETERHTAERRVAEQLAEKEVLLREIHHRVKNNLQVVSSLLFLQQQTTASPEVRTILRESCVRVGAMALVHEKLYSSSPDLGHIDLADYARDLAAGLFSTYGTDPAHVSLSVEGHGVAVTLDQAVPYGLILTEIVSNSLKHAFPHDRRGRIDIGFEATDHAIVMVAADDGVGTPKLPTRRDSPSLGRRLIERLTAQLGGNLEELGPPGTVYRLTVSRPPA